MTRPRLLGILVTALVAGSAPGMAQPQAPMGHGGHGTPSAWRFTWPAGQAPRGRAVFERLECYACHEVKGERFPAPSDRERVGPELSMMAALHDPEYFAEALVNPGAVIEKRKGYEASEGSSKMPSFNHLLTVEELIDLVAYLRALAPGGRQDGAAPAGGHGGQGTPGTH